MRQKKISDIESQVKRMAPLIVGRKDFSRCFSRFKKALENTCLQRFGCLPHSEEMKRFIANHPEMY